MCLTETPLELTLLQTSSLHMHTCGCILPKRRMVSLCFANPFCLGLGTTRTEIDRKHSCAMWHLKFMLCQDLTRTLPSWLSCMWMLSWLQQSALSQTQLPVSRPQHRPVSPSIPPALGVPLSGAALAQGSWCGTSTHSHWLSATRVHCCPSHDALALLPAALASVCTSLCPEALTDTNETS